MTIVEAANGFAVRSGIDAFMNTRYGWPTVESVHFIGLTVLMGTVGLFDLRILGVARGVSMATLHRLVPLGLTAFAVSVLTGMMFFVTATSQYLYNPAFQSKMVCIAVAGVNTAVFYATSVRAVNAAGPDADAPLLAKAVAAISLMTWMAVIVLGRIITIFRPPYYHWCAWCGAGG